MTDRTYVETRERVASVHGKRKRQGKQAKTSSERSMTTLTPQRSTRNTKKKRRSQVKRDGKCGNGENSRKGTEINSIQGPTGLTNSNSCPAGTQ